MDRPGHYEKVGDIEEWVWDEEPTKTPVKVPVEEEKPKPKRVVKKAEDK